MKLQLIRILSLNLKYNALYFETVKQHDHDIIGYVGINIDSTISTEYWTDLDDSIGLCVSHNNNNKTFKI